MITQAVPTIDIAPFQEGTETGKKQVARKVSDACETIGFLVISGHGIPQEVFDRAFGAAFAFFDMPFAEKQGAMAEEGVRQRGYVPFASRGLAATLGQQSPPDLRESFFLGPLDNHRAYYRHISAAAMAYRANIWPQKPSTFRVPIRDYYRAVEQLSAMLMAIFATALGLPEDYFADKIDKHFSILALHHYPVPDTAPLPGQLRTGAHTDFGSLTILSCTDAAGGLQARTSHGQWCDVRPGPGELVVNLGDMMARWTNARWKSTLHRVVNPPEAHRQTSRRLSMGYFMHPNYDTRIECLPGCSSPDAPPKYPPITAGQHIREKIDKSYTQ